MEMKIKQTILFSCFLALCIPGFSQKIAYTSVAEIASAMPEVKLAEANLETERKRAESQIEAQMKQLEERFLEIQKTADNYSPQQLEGIEKDLQTQQANLQEQYRKLSESFEQKVNLTLQPIEDKILKAISLVANENGYDYVVESNSYLVVHGDDKHKITELVKAKLKTL